MDIVEHLRNLKGVYVGAGWVDQAIVEIERLRALELPPPGHVLLPDGRCVKVSAALALALEGRANDEAAAAAQAASKEKPNA
jgi:hypothetical protein